MHKVLCVGPQWRGSNAGGLFKAIARQGHLIEIIDEFYEIPLKSRAFSTKVVSKTFRKLFINEYNRKIIDECVRYNPNIVFIYKGAFVLPETINQIKNSKTFIVNFYPDVSFHTHGNYLKNSLPLYDFVFTTKLFGINDLKEQLGIHSSAFIPHGFDPEIHRPIDSADINNNQFISDVSFIGTWSPKKEDYLKTILNHLPHIDLKIFGNQWENADEQVQSRWIRYEVLGDSYALTINSCKINLGLLSEQVLGASSGDQITSRTFHIPASGGFLLHERTEEVLNYFNENQEIVCFDNDKELIQKISYFLENEIERENIRSAGNKRAIKDHSLDQRASAILKIIKEKME